MFDIPYFARRSHDGSSSKVVKNIFESRCFFAFVVLKLCREFTANVTIFVKPSLFMFLFPFCSCWLKSRDELPKAIAVSNGICFFDAGGIVNDRIIYLTIINRLLLLVTPAQLKLWSCS